MCRRAQTPFICPRERTNTGGLHLAGDCSEPYLGMPTVGRDWSPGIASLFVDISGSGPRVGFRGLGIKLVGHEGFRTNNPCVVTGLDHVRVSRADLDLGTVVMANA